MNSSILAYTKKSILPLGMACAVFMLSGCGGGGGGSTPTPQEDYAFGFDVGYSDDLEYFFGYDDSFLNETEDEVWYEGDLIPYLDEISFDAGYYDGIFEAYNDGYFVAYRYAFIIGFSEGYDNAYWDDYLDFLAGDWHDELLHAGFSDGYNDGFSEGRIFGAYDYEAFLEFDWLDAFLDWESGTDLYFEEVDKGTGEFGPVVLYEWGINPHEFFASPARSIADGPKRPTKKETLWMRMVANELTRSDPPTSSVNILRTLTEEQEALLSVSPTETDRSDRILTLTTTWGERINSYNQSALGLRATPQNTRTEDRTKK